MTAVRDLAQKARREAREWDFARDGGDPDEIANEIAERVTPDEPVTLLHLALDDLTLAFEEFKGGVMEDNAYHCLYAAVYDRLYWAAREELDVLAEAEKGEEK